MPPGPRPSSWSAVATGLLAEAVGVATGLPFGDYAYGDSLGWRVLDVPLVVPLAWAMFAYPCLLVGRRLGHPVLAGAWALASWDLFLDPQMVAAHHWHWLDVEHTLPGIDHVPVSNFLGWALVAALLMSGLHHLPQHTDDTNTDDLGDVVPAALFLWTYFSSVVANAVFFGRPGWPSWADWSWVSWPSPTRGAPGAVRWLLWALTAHTALNARLLRTPVGRPLQLRTSVLLPVRDEAHRLEPCLRSLLAQDDDGRMEIVVLDDGSTDGTLDLVRRLVGEDPRCVVLEGAPLPTGWLGKPHACQQLADAADPASEVLVFVDADVVLEPQAIAATVAALQDTGLDLVSPYPRQEAPGATRLVQPLLQWSWLTFLPLRLAERSPRPSLSVANGQLLAVRRDAYRRAGGHAAVRDQVVEDVGLLRFVKRAGGRGTVVDGTAIATTRMYDGWPALREGYGKSLHTTPVVVPALLTALYLLPLLGRHRRSVYAAAVLGRVIAARRTGGSVLDALLHPVSIAAYVALDARSRVAHRRGGLTWKGRVL